jgi:CBS domain-containing protein
MAASYYSATLSFMEAPMRADQIMTRTVITIKPGDTIAQAAMLMLQRHISGLPVVDSAGSLIGIISEADFLRRIEIGTQKRRGRWLQFLLGPGKAASDFVHDEGRKVSELMTRDPLTITPATSLGDIVDVMERKHIKRLPVVAGGRLVGIVTRSNLLQAVSGLAGAIPDPTGDDDQIRHQIINSIETKEWGVFGLGVVVKDGIVHLSGMITDDRLRQASIVAAENVTGVKAVHDHFCWVDPMSGM